MAEVKINNNAASRLASSISAGVTSLSVTSGEGSKFPSPTAGDWFPVTVLKSSGQLEIMRCTARTGDVLTVSRGQEGSSALAFDAGDRVELRATAAVFAELQSKTADAQQAADDAQQAADDAQADADLGVKKDAATDTGAAKMPAGTAAQRPVTPQNGMERYNSEIHDFEYYINGAWVSRTTLTRALNEAPIVTLASAATVNIGAAGANTISISGTTTITAFDTIASGATRRLVFQGALTLTHNSTSLILPGSANITTAAGDVAEFVSLGSGNWRCIGYQKASGAPVGAIFSKEYISTEQTITAGGQITLAHGLGDKPKLIAAFLVCKTAEGGYSVGDEVAVTYDNQATNSLTYGMSVVRDTTNLVIRFSSTAQSFILLNKGSGAAFSITNANWRLVMGAWA